MLIHSYDFLHTSSEITRGVYRTTGDAEITLLDEKNHSLRRPNSVQEKWRTNHADSVPQDFVAAGVYGFGIRSSPHPAIELTPAAWSRDGYSLAGAKDRGVKDQLGTRHTHSIECYGAPGWRFRGASQRISDRGLFGFGGPISKVVCMVGLDPFSNADTVAVGQSKRGYKMDVWKSLFFF